MSIRLKVCILGTLFLIFLSGCEPAEPTEPSLVVDAPEIEADSQVQMKAGSFSQIELIEDARQLARTLEEAHPDPYTRGGGKIAFHRRLQQLLESIPEEGMTREEFIRLIRPFVASVGDSHTEIWDEYKVKKLRPGGVPLLFKVVEESLYVAGVPEGTNAELIGARLVSVEGLPLDELRERQNHLAALENQYNVLEELAMNTLWYQPYLQELIPEWEDNSHIAVALQLPDGEIGEYTFALPQDMSRLDAPSTQVQLPTAGDSGFIFSLIDQPEKVAYLRVEQMSNYREAREMETGGLAPHLKSATETFRTMVEEMESNGTETLIVDLRENQGGHSIMGDILVYFLYGKETLQDVSLYPLIIGGGMIRKYSDLFWSRTTSWTSLEQVNEGRQLPLEADDYDFSADYFGKEDQFLAYRDEAIAHDEDNWFFLSPTFWDEYQSEDYSGYYTPKHVIVLVDAKTFSSGFTMLRYLYLAGATLVGTPSGQAANSFGNGQLWHLEHTSIEGTVSTTYSVMFPDDTEMAYVLPVDYPLTYEKLREYGFDPNAAFLYALEIIEEQ